MGAKQVGFSVLGVFVFLFLVVTFFGSWYTIDQGSEGVILRNGALVGTSPPGLHFKLPFFDSIEYISLQQQAQGYDQESSFTQDQQEVFVKLSVLFHVPQGQGAKVYSEYGSIENMVHRLISRKVPAILKDVAGQYTIQTIVTQRQKFNADVLTALQTNIVGPLVIDGANIENVDTSKQYQQSIEAKQLAEVAVAQQKQILAQQEVQAQITVTNAKAAADAQVAAAQAKATAIKLAGEAEAAAIQAKGQALKDNPGVVEYMMATQWDGKLPTTMVPNSSVPFLNVSPPSAVATTGH